MYKRQAYTVLNFSSGSKGAPWLQATRRSFSSTCTASAPAGARLPNASRYVASSSAAAKASTVNVVTTADAVIAAAVVVGAMRAAAVMERPTVNSARSTADASSLYGALD